MTPTDKQIVDAICKWKANTTKEIAALFNISTKEAYSICNKLSKKNVLLGEISKGGMSRGRGESRKGLPNTLSMSWWPNYRHPDDFKSLEEYYEEAGFTFDEAGKFIGKNSKS